MTDHSGCRRATYETRDREERARQKHKDLEEARRRGRNGRVLEALNAVPDTVRGSWQCANCGCALAYLNDDDSIDLEGMQVAKGKRHGDLPTYGLPLREMRGVLRRLPDIQGVPLRGAGWSTTRNGERLHVWGLRDFDPPVLIPHGVTEIYVYCAGSPEECGAGQHVDLIVDKPTPNR